MRILIAVHGYPPTRFAGAERTAERMVKWLTAHHHQVEVFTVESLTASSFSVQTAQENGLTIHRVSYNVKAGDYFRNLYDYPPIGEALRGVLSRGHFDLVHLMSGYLLGGQVVHTAHEYGIPVVITLTEYWFMCARLNLMHPNDVLCSGPESDAKCLRCIMEEKRRYRLPARYASRLMDAFWLVAPKMSFTTAQMEATVRRRETLHEVLDAADFVISPSRFLINKYADFGFDTRRYHLIRHGLNAQPVFHNPLPTSPVHALRLGYTGQIKSHKGVDLIIEACLPLLDAGYALTLDLWGPNNEIPAYSRQLQEMTAAYPAIRWNGRYDLTHVWDVLSSFDVLIVPSRWYENSPFVILEAYKIGRPVIATNLGGMAEMVEDEKSGLLFELNNADDLRRQIARLIDDQGLLERLRAGIPHVKTLDEEMTEIVSVYQHLLQEHAEQP